MLNVTQNDPIGQRLAGYAQRLENAANKWTSVDNSLASADRFVGSADRQFEQAWFPQRQAERDNERTDSSWQGRDLQRQFRFGKNEVDRAEGEVRRGSFDLNDLDRDVSQTNRELDQLVADMRQSNDPRLPLVLQACQQVGTAQGSFNGAAGSLNRFDSSSRFLDNDVFRADYPINAIAGDRPGLNVSRHAYQVGNSLRDIDRELQDMDWALTDAGRQGDQAQGQLRGAAQKLTQASNTPGA
jgi:hypothetical protein